MTKNNSARFKSILIILVLFSIVLFNSCKEDEPGSFKEDENDEQIDSTEFEQEFVNLLDQDLTSEIYEHWSEIYSQLLNPWVKFKYPINTEFSLSDSTQTHLYRISLDSISLSSVITSEVFNFEQIWIDSSLIFSPEKIFDTEDHVLLYIKCDTEVLLDDVWTSVTELDSGFVTSFTQSYPITDESIDFSVFRRTIPENNDSISTFNQPEITFKRAINNSISTRNHPAISITPRITSLTYQNMSSGTDLSVDTVWGDFNFSLTFNSPNTLPPHNSFEIKSNVEYFKQIGEYIIPLVDQERNTIADSINLRFHTKKEVFPEGKLVPNNIEFSYPVNLQYHYLQDEANFGFLKLKNAPYTVENLLDQSWEKFIRLVNHSDTLTTGHLIYDPEQLRFEFPIDFNLQNETIYRIDFVLRNIKTGAEQVFYSINFRTSIFNSFQEKIENIEFTNTTWRSEIKPGVHEIGQAIRLHQEFFDCFEVFGCDVLDKGLVQFESSLDMPYYTENLYPLIYYGIDNGILNLRRQKGNYGIPPTKAMILYQYPNFFKLDRNAISSNYAPTITWPSTIISRILNDVFYYAYLDYLDLREQAYLYKGENEWIETIKRSNYPTIQAGYYPYTINYTLPDGTITSSSEMSMYIK